MFNDRNKKRLRQILRKEMPKGEQILWQRLRKKQLGHKFFRQYSIGKYVVDFYCPKLKLVIEIDGITHEQKSVGDKYRQKYLENIGSCVERFNSKELFDDIDSVLESIYFCCKRLDKK
ncbi:MAG: endonuclease domain-containing protein [Candidatus Jacksonbacteria bacterium]|nr:endonuclease domain-containing protein [Candidatus Jacksonbacteria bacterium]MBT6034784.1 endonuclease domain-containing protein [Candidatus Jacksonbacteria bacterium]MBT6301090.1 endonuclease domain-containing protein [Candidatus Jacksonbacteria bacterium]MBT6757522.1 endonuclease domain-containing protein [Candidatus Jacksonbacteria bacterium]MBT6955599.1 endonuclease domain-containing protein [Candidatus Jacksonbacteria bacterium]